MAGVPSFARGPDSTSVINLPNNTSAGIPLNISSGTGVTAGTFTLMYNAALLDISGATLNSALSGASLSLDPASTPGEAIIDFAKGSSTLSSGVVNLGGLVATVPNSAAAYYGGMALLHFSGVALAGSGVTAMADDAVQVVAYFGDAAGDGDLNSTDPLDISDTAVNLYSGFSAYPLANPATIADIANDGAVDSTAVLLMDRYLAGISTTQIPTPNPNSLPLPTVTTGSLPTFMVTRPGNSLHAGSSSIFTVTALDANADTDVAFNGTVQIASSDSQAVLPADVMLVNGIGVFSATLKTAGSQSLTVVDGGSSQPGRQQPNAYLQRQPHGRYV